MYQEPIRIRNIKDEIECYYNGVYEIDYIETSYPKQYFPYGPFYESDNKVDNCHGCGQHTKITHWVNRRVKDEYSIAYYCNDCSNAGNLFL